MIGRNTSGSRFLRHGAVRGHADLWLVADRQAIYAYDYQTNKIPDEPAVAEPYWRDVGTIDSFFDAHMDLISVDPVFNLYNEDWPILTWTTPMPPASRSCETSGRGSPT